MNDVLDLPGAIELSRDTAGDACIFEAKTAVPNGAACKLSCKLRRNGTKLREINDVPHLGKPTLVRYHVQRFACPDCVNEAGEVVGSNGVYERLPFLQEGTWMTKRLIVWMAKQAMRRTFASVSRDASVDPKTAAKGFNLYVDERIALLKRETPRVLGIDEKKLLGDFRAVLGNIEAKTVLDMLPDREETLERRLIKLAGERRIEVVVTDRYDGYRNMIRKRMPRCLHVTDRFHITRAANLELDKIRAGIAKGLPDRQQGARLRMSAKLFKLRWRDATDEQKATIKQWCAQIPKLHDAYWAKEHYCDMYLCDTPAEAERYYKTWLRDLPESVKDRFAAACSIPRRWMPMVLAYFEEPYTTGYVESVNRFLDDLQRDGRGYAFEVIRAKLMLAEKLENKTFRPKKRITSATIRMEHGIDVVVGGRRWGADLNELHGLFEPPQIIQWGDREIAIARGLSTLHPEFDEAA